MPKTNPLGDELRRGEMHLPCRLTAKEIQERQDDLVKLTQDRVDLEIGLDHWKADKKEEQKAKDGEIRAIASRLGGLAKVLKERKENRPVEVIFYIKDGNVTSLRADSGEKITTRPASPGELQMMLPDAEKKDAGA